MHVYNWHNHWSLSQLSCHLYTFIFQAIKQKGMLTTFPQCNFSLEFPEIFSENHICYHWLCVSGISKIMHCGTLINRPYCTFMINEHANCLRYPDDTRNNIVLQLSEEWGCLLFDIERINLNIIFISSG